jgi:hypothetical protein
VKPYLREVLSQVADDAARRALVREYLQARILECLQRAGAMIPLALHGGTCLRFLYDLPRYSEDLDFALERRPEQYDFSGYLAAIRRDLAAEGYTLEIRLSDQKVVHSAFIRFRGLLHEFGLSPHADQVLAIKLEVDTRPPAGAGLATTLVDRHVPLHLQHHDRSSLFAGKNHALLQRAYAKGRDWYDLGWYLRQPGWPRPNLVLLNAALTQTGWEGELLTPDNWKQHLRARLEGLDWNQVAADVAPFILDPEEILSRTQILRYLEAFPD